MATMKMNTAAPWNNGLADHTHDGFWDRSMAFADSHEQSKTLFFLVSMIVQGVFFLPVPALLMYYFNAPGILLIITLGLFFANIIAGMGGSGIRTMIALFGLSILVNLVMLSIFII